MQTNYSEWFRRTHFPPLAHGPLGISSDHWDPNPEQYEGCSQLRERYADLGRIPTDSDLVFRLSKNLLPDVLVAAGGIERAMARLKSAVARLESWAVKNGVVGIPTGIAGDASVDAWYAFAEIVFWTRSLSERLDRKPFGDRTLRRQGLVPALRPGQLATRARCLLTTLRSGPLREACLWANFGLHASLVSSPNSGARLAPSGSVTLPMPDTPTHPVGDWYVLTWDEDRDALVFADALWKSVQDFIDALLEAFEQAALSRRQR